MFRTLLLGAAAVLVLQTPVAARQVETAPPVSTADATAAWRALTADWEAFERRENPFDAASEGDRSALGRLPDITPAAAARRLEETRRFRARLAALDLAGLSAQDRFDHGFLLREVDERIEAAKFDGARLAFNAEGGAGTTLGYVARSFPTATRADQEAWLRLLEAAPEYYADLQANADRGVRTRFTQPRSVVDSAIVMAEAEAALTLERDPLLIPLAKPATGVSAAEHAALVARARELITGRIQPARREWLRFLRETYLPAARSGLGVATLPGGRDYYAYLTRSYTTTTMTPDQVHEVGQAEVRRIRAEMDQVAKDAGWTGSFAEFLTFLRTDPRFYAKTRQELLEKASEISKRADAAVPALFRRSLPRLPYGVVAVPQEIEDRYTTGRYSQGSMALGKAGYYLVNTGKLDQRPLYELPALTVHEAVPGHHLQIAIAQELGEQPWFRRNASVTAFSEGWGLYAEFLGVEMGIYRDPYERFGRLSYEMWRACRLVADTGMHWKGWTIEQARACFRDNSALAPHNIETELQRYIGWPGQALAYKIGEIEMKAMRARAEQRLGDRFDVRAFHDHMLLGGPMPLDLLEARMDAWIAAGGPAE
jgi:uncharacterized protein (DUF885 family)